MDSFSFFISNQLGDDLTRYAMEAERLAATTKEIEHTQVREGKETRRRAGSRGQQEPSTGALG